MTTIRGCKEIGACSDSGKWLITRNGTGSLLLTTNEYNSIVYTQTTVAGGYCLLNVALESIVLYLLRTLKTHHGETVGFLLFLHLFFAEICISILSMLTLVLSVLWSEGVVVLEKDVVVYLVLVIVVFFTTTLYIVKLAVLNLKVLQVHLQLRFQSVCTIERCKNYLDCTWAFSLFLFIGAICANEMANMQLTSYYRYLILPGTIFFVVLVTASNIYLLCHLQRSRKPPHPPPTLPQPHPQLSPSPSPCIKDQAHRQKGCETFQQVLVRSQYLVPILVSSVFALFLTGASVESIVNGDSSKQYSKLNLLTFLVFNTMMTCDALIFLIAEPRVRTLIKNRWRRRRLRRTVNKSYQNKTRVVRESSADMVRKIRSDTVDLEDVENEENDVNSTGKYNRGYCSQEVVKNEHIQKSIEPSLHDTCGNGVAVLDENRGKCSRDKQNL